MAVSVRRRLAENRRTARAGVWVAVLGILSVVPFVLPSFQTGLVIEMMILVLFAASYDLLIGYAGIISFGHALPLGTAAYMMGIVMAGRPLPLVPTGSLGFWPAVGLAILAVVVVSVVTGYLALQRSGVYFAMVTLAFSMVGYFLVFETTSITGGDNGLLVSRPEVFGLALSQQIVFYFTTLVIVALSYAALRRVTTSPFGRVLRSIRENEQRARFFGYDTFRYKLFAFTVAGLFAGVAGVLQGLYFNIITPSMMYWSTGGDALLITLIGGMGTLWGAIVGTVMLLGTREVLTGITENWPIVLGIVYVLFVPKGLAGLVTDSRSVWDAVGDLLGDEEVDDIDPDAEPEGDD
jgi:branched-chain amino acid transport system permease protein